jgi:hypothetical protein
LNYVKQSHENAVKIANIEIELKYLKSALVFAGLGHYRNIIKFNRENTFDKDFTALASEAQLFLPVPKLVSKSTGKTWTEFEVEVVNANSRPATEKNELLFKYYSTILAKYQRLKQERKKLLNLEFEIQYQYAQGIQRLHYTMLSTHRWVKSYKHSTEALTSVDKLVLDELNLEFNRMLNILNELKKPLLKAQNYLSAKVKESERLTHSNNAIDAKKKSNMLDEIFFSRLKKTLGIDFTSDSKGEITSKMDGFVRNQIDTFLQTHGTSLKELTPKNAKGPLDYFYNFVKVRIGTVALVSLLSTAGVTGYGKAVGVENVNPEKDLKLPTLVLESVKEFYSQKFNEDKLRIQEIQQRNGLNREQGIKELAEYMVNVVKADEERSLRAVEWYDQFHLDYFHKIMFESLESKKQEAIAAKEKKKIAILETKMKAHNNQELSLDEEMIRIATQVITLRGEVDSETNMIKKAQLLEKRKKEVNKQIANVMQWFEKRYGERVKGVSPEAVELRANLQELITNLYKTKSELKTMSINNVDTGEHNVNMNFIEIKINKINDPEIKQSATRFVYLIIGSHKIMYSQFNKGVFDEVIANLIKVADPDNLTGLVDFATEVLLPSTGQ